MSKDLSALVCPKSVALIGASSNPQKVGAIILENILASKFLGNIYPVNPHLENIQNLKCFKSVSEIPEVPELAVLAIPADKNIEVLNQIGEKGIKNVICLAAGFKEIGEKGKKLEDQLLETAKKYEINLLGPNCLGLINNLCPINATFGEAVNLSGNLRFISQSGALAASLFDWCKSENLGFSQFITLGNKTDINENDILQYFQENKPSSPIGLYLESITDGKKFLEIAKQICKIAPIFILKPGKTKDAVSAMQSHTGSIAGADDVLDEALKEAGVIRCDTLEDFFDLSQAFSLENMPKGPRLGIVSNAGGPAVISADAIFSNGLKLTEFDEQTKQKLTEILPHSASILNPVDILGDALAGRFTQAAEIILQTDQADILMVILTPQAMTEIEQTAENIGILSKKYQKPIFCAFLGGEKVLKGEKILNHLKIPVFRFPERAIYAIGAMWQWKKQQLQQKDVNNMGLVIPIDQQKIQVILQKAKTANQKTLDNLQANEILSVAGISTPPTSEVGFLDQAKDFVKTYGFPVVLKLSSPDFLHKKEVGGVITGIGNDEQLETAWDKLERKITHLPVEIQSRVAIQIQKDILNGVEVIVGIKEDKIFGKVLLFGAGGTLTELINDKNLHLLPIDILQTKKLVEKSKIFSLLSGFRGEPVLALEKIYEVIVKLGKLAESFDDIKEIEINPLIVTLNDVWAVDPKVILEPIDKQIFNAPKFKLARAKEKVVLANKYYYFDLETEEPLSFLPGQYISIKVGENKVNCYSIAHHEGGNKFSLLVDTTPGGLGSKFFENLNLNDKVAYLGPFGNFTLKSDGAKQILFLATGSGAAPLRCQIEQALKEKNIKTPITLYLGLETNKDLFWQDVFQKLAQNHSNFNFKIAIHDPQWGYSGYKGYITELLKNDILDGSGVSAYLCGNKNMIKDATEILLEGGCPKERIYTEKY